MAATDIQEYYEWLCDKIHLNDQYANYRMLIGELFKRPYSGVPESDIDSTRIRKARELYDEFCEEFPCVLPPPMHDDISVLELLVSLAESVEMILKDEEYGDRTSTWFWDMVSNLKLMPYTDECFDLYSVTNILNIFCLRKYTRTGKGSIAYTKQRYNGNDFRKMDVWQQVSIYYSEKFFIQDGLMSVT